MIGFALGNVFIGRSVDRYGIMWPILIASIALGSGFLLAAISVSIWQFALIQGVLIGAGNAATFGPLLADISHWFNRRRGIAVALTASGNYLAGAIWPTLLQGILQTEGWRVTYMIIGTGCLVIMLPLALLLRAPPPSDPGHQSAADRQADQSARRLAEIRASVTPQRGQGEGTVEPAIPAAGASPMMHQPQLLTIDLSPGALQALLVVAGLGCCMAMSMPQIHIVAYAVDLGYGIGHGAQILALMLLGGVVSRIASGGLADRIGAVKTLLAGSVLQCVALIVYMPASSLSGLYAVSLLFGLAQGGIVPSYALMVREYLPAREAGRRVGTVIMATIIGMAIGGWMAGFIYDITGSYQAAFINAIGWNLLNLSIIVMILMRTRRRVAPVAAVV
jgi:MFS family permease